MSDYECGVCGASFESPDELRDHIKSDHPGEKDGNFLCNDCGEMFSTKDELVEHRNSVHPQE